MTKAEVLAWLERKGRRRDVEGLARYGIVAARPFGVPMKALQVLAKRIGKDQALSLSLWASGRFEARLLAAMVGEPQRVTRRQMDAWAAAFDSWAMCDTVCWSLFDYTPFAWQMARKWSRSPREFVKRAAFATLAGQAGHNKKAADAEFLAFFPVIERGARDERNFVKKGVSWALRRIGGRSPALHAAALELAGRLAASENAASRWVGRDVQRDLTRPVVRARVARRAG